MIIKRKHLKKLVRSYLHEQDFSKQWESDEFFKDPMSWIGARVARYKPELEQGAYYRVSPDEYYSISSGVGDYKSITTLDPEIKTLLELIAMSVLYQNDGDIDRTRRDVVVTSLKRDAKAQVDTWKVKFSQGETVEKIAMLYHPSTDPTATDATYATALEALEELQAGNEADAVSLVKASPVSSHFDNRAIDFRIAEGRKAKIDIALDMLEEHGMINKAEFFYNEEKKPPHYHFSIKPGSSPVTTKGKSFLNRMEGYIESEPARDYAEKLKL